MTLLVLALGIILLFALIVGLKLNSFLALIITSLVVGLAEGIPVQNILTSIVNGVGGTLGELVLIVGFGAMLGKLMSECGAAQKIAVTLIDKFGKTNVSWSICLISFIIGIAMFYEVGFVLLMPLIVSVAVAIKIPLLRLGIPMAASLSVAHAFLPPHPGATAVAILLNADIGLTLLYGIIVSIPVVIISGPLFTKIKAIHKINISQNIRLKPRVAQTKSGNEEIKLNEKEKKYIDDIVEGIKDDKLKEILTKLGKSVILSNRE